MKKIAAFLLTFTLANLAVNEIREQRAQECFGCRTTKCVIRVIDKDPKLLFTHPLEIARSLVDVPYWWD